MKKRYLPVLAALGLILAVAVLVPALAGSKDEGWKVNATVIEACSCPMFCQCYFNTRPAGHPRGGHGAHGGHGGEHGSVDHYCRFNMAWRVNKGHAGSVKLDGARWWVSGDLGSEFDDGVMDWAVVTFDKSTTPEQRAALAGVMGALFPVEWKEFSTGEGVIDWKHDGNHAHATLDGGASGEVKLTPVATAQKSGDPVVIRNLTYWAAPSNDGFVLMPNEVQAWRKGEKAFETRGTNGFMITIDMDSQSVN